MLAIFLFLLYNIPLFAIEACLLLELCPRDSKQNKNREIDAKRWQETNWLDVCAECSKLLLFYNSINCFYSEANEI